MSIEDVQRELRDFAAEREWKQFHAPENLAKSISIEAGELLEEFQWGAPSEAEREDVLDELADVLTYCFHLADALDADPLEIIRNKLEKTRAKYPIEKARGRSTKYDEL